MAAPGLHTSLQRTQCPPGRRACTSTGALLAATAEHEAQPGARGHTPNPSAGTAGRRAVVTTPRPPPRLPPLSPHAAGTARFSKATPTTSSRAVMAFKLVTICVLRTNDKSHSTAFAHPPPAPQEHTVPGHPGYLHRTLSWLGPDPSALCRRLVSVLTGRIFHTSS